MKTPKKRGKKPIPDSHLLKDLQKVARQLKQNRVGMRQYRVYGKYSIQAMVSHFGSWNKAAAKAKLKQHHWYTEKELLDDIRRVAKEIKPAKLNWKIYQLKGNYARSTQTYRFGSWLGAMKKAGLVNLRKQTK